MVAKLLWIEVGEKVYSQWPQLEFKRYLHFSASAMHSAHFIYLFIFISRGGVLVREQINSLRIHVHRKVSNIISITSVDMSQ